MTSFYKAGTAHAQDEGRRKVSMNNPSSGRQGLKASSLQQRRRREENIVKGIYFSFSKLSEKKNNIFSFFYRSFRQFF
jgi:hypothetical protein